MEHQLRNGALPQKLLMAASVLGLPVAALKGLTYRQLQQNMATAEHQQAQYTVLLPSVEQLTQASEQCLALCQQVQGVTDDNMTCCVLVYHEGQLTVLNAVKSQIEALRYVEQPVI